MSANTAFPLPPDLPKPMDDGAARHLPGLPLPQIELRSTSGRWVDLAHLDAPRTVIYCYPKTGVPGTALPAGWDQIPGARGCTPQSCSFRDHYQDLRELQTEVFGLSTQSSDYQREMASRLKLPFEILSDADFKFSDAIRLPTFQVEGERLLKRLTLIVRAGSIEHVLYPVFPPDQSAAETIAWLRAHPLAGTTR